MTKPEKRRLFFALCPDPGVRARIQQQADTVRATTDGRAVVESNLHLTLAFLGSVPADEIEALRSTVAGIGSGPFTLEIDRTGWWKKTGILWLAPSVMPAGLSRTVESLWSRLRPRGFKADFHKFRPHVTIARKCSHPSPVGIESIRWTVGEFALLESETHPKGACYSVLNQWSLDPHAA
ncbi:MAG: RNA 2',3'-cyclic phosphodiesterase [Gammaproteobacteria bacterium]